jgi:hypothetical protein
MMSNFLTIDNVLSDIEVELIQGAVSRDDLGRGLQNVRQHHNQLRTTLFGSDAAQLDLRDVASRQFQVNDMLLTLLQESIAKVQALQLEVRKAARLTLRASTSAGNPSVDPGNGSTYLATPAATERDDDVIQRNEALKEAAQSIDALMRAERLKLKVDAQPVRLPLIGGLLGRLRSALHSLTLFYTNRLGEQQSEVNQGYGEWLLRLYTQNQEQQAELRLLRAELYALQSRLATGQFPANSSSVQQ